MKHFVPTGSGRTLTCINEKFIVDFALSIGMLRQSRHTQQSKSFYENLRGQLVTQYQDVQRGLESVFTPHSTTAISWLTEFITSMEPGYQATRLVREKLLQLEQTAILTSPGAFDEYSPPDKLRTQLTFKLKQIENQLQSINLMERGRKHYEQVLTRWDHGSYFPFSPAGRCYVALQELYWGAFGEAVLLADDLQNALWPRLDVLYINAGDVTHHSLEEWDEQSYDRLMNTNLKGPFFLIQALLSQLANPSSVIVCGSVSARIGLPQSNAYAASKAGILSLARTLSGELHHRGIRVNGLSPGPTETPALGKLGSGPADDALRESIRELVPIGRLGTALELAKAAVFLASDESAFIVGTDLLVDGGVGNL